MSEEETCVFCGESYGPDAFEDGLRCKICAERDELEADEQVLMRFLDGPLAGQGNLPDALGDTHTFTVPKEQYGWPLPERLCVLAHLEHVAKVAIWDPETEGDKEDALPVEIRESPNRVTYIKVAESQRRANR